jgi:hypothetical protein
MTTNQKPNEPSDSAACSTAEDDMDFVFCQELRMLHAVFSASSDLVMASWNTEFCEACGGIEELKNKHVKAVRELEQWYADGDDAYCR